MAKLAQRLGLDLANAFPCDAELAANLFQGAAAPVLQAEAQYEQISFPLTERVERLTDVLVQQALHGRIGRANSLFILEKIAEMALFLCADRRLEGNRLLAQLEHFGNTFRRQVHVAPNLGIGGIAAVFLDQTPACPRD